MKSMSKKGFALSEIPSIGMIFVIIAIVFSVGATILTQMQGTQTASGHAYNITGQGVAAISSLSGWMPTWVTVVAAAVVLGVVVTYLYFKNPQ